MTFEKTIIMLLIAAGSFMGINRITLIHFRSRSISISACLVTRKYYSMHLIISCLYV